MSNKGSTLIPPVDKLWTSREVAEYMRLDSPFSYQVVERWAREGRLRCGYAGDKPRFKKEHVDDFVFSKRR